MHILSGIADTISELGQIESLAVGHTSARSPSRSGHAETAGNTGRYSDARVLEKCNGGRLGEPMKRKLSDAGAQTKGAQRP